MVFPRRLAYDQQLMVESLQAEVTVCEPIKTATDEIAITKPARVHSLFYFDHSRERPMEAFADTPPEARSQIEEIQNQMVALLSRLQNFSTQFGDNLNVEESEMLLQQALNRISVATEDEREDWLDEIDWKAFGNRLVQRRTSAMIQQKELANLVGVTPQTIRNIESATKRPSRELLIKLLTVTQLRLRVSDITGDSHPDLVATSWFALNYDPMAMMTDMKAKINGSGDSLEQSTAYLDSQSAEDWLSIAMSPGFIALHGNTRPLEDAAQIVTGGAERSGLTIVALGSGDARREVAFSRFCANKLNSPADLMLRLLDISHSLLAFGYNHAKEMLVPLGVSVMTMHANFHDLSKYPIFDKRPKKHRQRVLTLLGNTLANLDNEVRFFRDTLSGCRPGDYFLADFTVAHAPAVNPDEVMQKDPVFQSPLPATRQAWLSGPLKRYGKGMIDVDVSVELDTNCTVRGSYEVLYVAKATMGGGLPDRRFSVFRCRCYDPDKLTECLERLGWKARMVVPYASNERNKIMLMLLQKQ
jgi:transcriptional regulator with XRE-family HTH domain